MTTVDVHIGKGAAFVPPVADIRFALEVVGYDELVRQPAFAHADADTVAMLLREFGRLAADVVAPLDRAGDLVGSRLDQATGRVTTPPGFAEAYRRLVDGGWLSLSFPVSIGGGGLPRTASLAFEEVLTGANMALSLCPMLTHSAAELLARWGSPAQQAAYLPRLITGEWTGTMNLTEPDAGSDVGALQTAARPAPDGSWLVSGTKIFVTWGAHDMAEETVHLVLARVPGAPAGVKGISLFLVPTTANRVRCVSVEEKLGIHASPTCVLAFEDARAELVGEVNGGLKAMFTMMNSARLSVAVEGLAVAERAYQQAVAYAAERRQGRLPGQAPDVSVPIVEHPDVHRTLVSMRSHIEAMRLLLYTTAHAGDRGDTELVDLLIPVAKAWCTDLGVEISSSAVQVHGGMGFIEETGVAQRYRDARIAPIYEGTNGIHGIDLVMRKLGRGDGSVFARLTAAVRADAAPGSPLADAVDAWQEAAAWLSDRIATAPLDALAGATPFTRMTGDVLGGWLLGRQAAHAHAAEGPSPRYLSAKQATARFYERTVLPAVRGLLPAVTAGHEVVAGVPATDLASS